MRQLARHRLLVFLAVALLVVVVAGAVLLKCTDQSSFQGRTLLLTWQQPLPPAQLSPHPSRMLVNRRFTDGLRYILLQQYTTTPHGTIVTLERHLSIPLWQIAIPPTALIVVWAILIARLLRRHPIGLCRSCGYDLRASPERCPECGALTDLKVIA